MGHGSCTLKVAAMPSHSKMETHFVSFRRSRLHERGKEIQDTVVNQTVVIDQCFDCGVGQQEPP